MRALVCVMIMDCNPRGRQNQSSQSSPASPRNGFEIWAASSVHSMRYSVDQCSTCNSHWRIYRAEARARSDWAGYPSFCKWPTYSVDFGQSGDHLGDSRVSYRYWKFLCHVTGVQHCEYRCNIFTSLTNYNLCLCFKFPKGFPMEKSLALSRTKIHGKIRCVLQIFLTGTF
jgi:hypothetical protein